MIFAWGLIFRSNGLLYIQYRRCQSEESYVVIPVEVRDVLGIKNKKSFVRLDEISVAEIVDDNGDDGD